MFSLPYWWIIWKTIGINNVSVADLFDLLVLELCIKRAISASIEGFCLYNSLIFSEVPQLKCSPWAKDSKLKRAARGNIKKVNSLFIIVLTIKYNIKE